MKMVQTGRTLMTAGIGALLALAAVRPVRAADFSAWPMKMKITFTGYTRSEALTNFPALVVFTNNLAGHFRYNQMASPEDAGDLRFSAADGTTELSYEVDTWIPDGTSTVWVRLPLLTSNTDFIYAYWGNGNAATPPAYTANGAAWAPGYKAVWHLGGSGGTRPDSTSNGFTGILDASGVAPSSAGKIGGADLFTGTGSAYPTSGGISCGNVSVPGSQTIEMWLNVANRTERRNPLNKAYGGEGTLVIEVDGRAVFYHGTSGADSTPNQANTAPAGTVVANQWVHLAHVRDLASPATLRWFVNGQQISSVASAYATAVASTRALTLGKGYVFSYNGLLDEVRVSSAAYSSNRIWACWLNTANPAAFQTLAPLEASLPLVTIAPASNITATSAWLNGSLMSTGSSATAVSLYWGMSSGGTHTTNWTYSSVWAEPQTPSEFSFAASNLTANSTCYFRMAASNESGVSWSRIENFITGELTISVASNAFEKTLTPGAFTLARPSTATNEALKVAYAITGGTAQPGVDFVALSGSVTIPAGAVTAAIPLVPLKNYTVSADTTVQVTLTGAAAIIGATSNATLTIVNEVMLDHAYVSKNGNNTDGTTWATAFTALQPAFNQVAANGTIHVAGGQTFELAAAAVWPAFGNITLRGGYEAVTGTEPGANDPVRWPTVLQPTAGAAVRVLTIANVAGATLENLTFRNGYVTTSPAYGGAIYASAVSGLTVRNCRFLRNKLVSSTSSYGGGLYALNSSGLITNTVFIGNYAASSLGHDTGSRGGAFYLSGGTWTLRDLWIQGNWTAAGSGAYRGSGYDMAGGIYLGGAGGVFTGKNLMVVNNDGGGIMLAAGTATLENLTVSGNDLVGISVAAGSAVGTTIRNSILYGNRDDFSGTAPKLHYNIIGDGTQAGNNGNLAGNPAFAFPLFYLADGSPALNSGTGTVIEAGLTGTTVQASGATDSGTVSRGYHFTSGVGWDLDLYVAPGGNGDGLSVGSPLGSITAALARTTPRMRIHIAAGTYTRTTETFPLAISGRAIQLLGTNAAVTIIDAASSGQRVVNVSEAPFTDNRIEGLTLRGGATTGGGAGVAVDCATLTVADTIIRNNTATVPSGTTQFGGGGLYAISATLFIEGASFLNNVAANSAGHIDGRAGGLEAWSGVDLRLHNSVFSGNIARKSGGTAYSLYAGGGVWLGRGFFQLRNLLLVNNIGGGVVVSASGGIANAAASPGISMLENLTAYGNNAEGVRVDASAAPTCSLRNSIAWTNVVADLGGTIPASIVYNCIGDGKRNGIDHNFNTAPLFVNAAGGDFRLQTAYGRLGNAGLTVRDPVTSPCIDTGTNQLWMSDAVDLSELPRIQQGRPGPKPHRVDIGAYESPAIPPRGTVMLVR